MMYCFRYYLGLAHHASLNSCDPIPSRLKWIFTPYGYKFFTSQKFSYTPSATSVPFSTLGNKADPMAYVMKVYREQLLERILQNLAGPSDRSEMSEEDRKIHVSEVLGYVQLLLDNVSRDVHEVFNSTSLHSKLY